MKKFVSLLLTALMLATMLTVFAVPASAENEPIECDTTRPTIRITSAGNYIIKQDCTLPTLEVTNKGCTLTIPKGVTVTVTCTALINSGKVILNGKLDVSQCTGGMINGNLIDIGENGKLLRGASKVSYTPKTFLATTLSEGNIWIIAIIAVVVIAGIATLVIVKKKKKPATAGGTDNTDEE